MALIGTIRKNFWFVLILLGFALVAFILMDIMSSSQRSAGTSPTIGKVEGSSIKFQDFQRTKSVLFSNSSADQGAIDNSVWSFYTEKALIQKEAKKLGLNVSRDELMELQFGNKLSPIINQNFGDPQTGQVNRTNLLSFKTAIEEGTFDNERMRLFWSEQEKQIIKTALQEKVNNLTSKGIYTPTWMVEEDFKNNNSRVDVEYIQIPFASVSNDEVSVSDADINAYLKENEIKYTNEEETRIADYIVFDVVASAADSSFWYEEASKIKERFITTENDSIYAVTNQGSFNNFYFTPEELPDSISAVIADLSIGDVYGPYMDQNAYTTFKLNDARIIPDSVKASHILRSVDPNIPGQIDDANTVIDSLLIELKAGKVSFSDAASANSQDPGSASKGGELGYFAQATMVPGFKDACFYYGKEGGYYKVQTQFGVHLIYIQDQKYNNRNPKYKVAFVKTPVIPTETTVSSVDQRVADLVSENKTLEELRTAVEGQEDLTIQSSSAFKSSDYIFGPLGGGNVSRDIIRWLFDSDNKVGEVSPEIYSYQNKQLYYYNKFVAVGLQSVIPAGLQSAAIARPDVEVLVQNELKGKILKDKITSQDLATLANEYNTTVETEEQLSFNAALGSKLANEPKVIAAAHNQAESMVSSPIIGKSGVYLVKTTKKYPTTEPSGIPQLRRNQNQSKRSQTTFKVIEALKKSSTIEDSRSALNL